MEAVLQWHTHVPGPQDDIATEIAMDAAKNKMPLSFIEKFLEFKVRKKM